MASLDGEVACQAEKTASLQDSFIQFRQKKQDELRARQVKQELSLKARSDPERMDELRKTFLETALTYIGTPYARSHPAPTYNSKLFLDCCGLVRHVIKDLKDEFGFAIGPWNQAYMFDVLPITLSGPNEMQPGDLVFVSAIYNNEKAKKQRHNMVHVEIWLGEGEKTLGARWGKRFVEVHDSYQYVSKAYHSMTYHFKSIDTWLKGVCSSVCPEHLWLVRKFDPSKKSIFSLEEDDACEDGGDCDSESEEVCKERTDNFEQEPKFSLKHKDQSVPQASENDEGEVTQPASVLQMPKRKAKTKRSGIVVSSLPRLSKTFVICGGNCASLVESALTCRGWVKCEDKQSTSFHLKWTELRTHIDYKSFREGEQMVNHFPNINLLTTKIGLLESLRSYFKIHRSTLKIDRILPLTYRLDINRERDDFIKEFQSGDMWICKPTGANQGKGIFLVRQLEEVLEKLEADKSLCKHTSRPVPRIVQRYISNPLLIDGRKFDIRVYMLIVAAKPFAVFYRRGYVRLCCETYSTSSDNLSVHLTNQYQQKKNPLYSQLKEDTVWDFNKFQESLREQYDLPQDWVETTLTRRMMAIMSTCFNSVKHKLTSSIGFFDLLGFDFMLDDTLNVWLIEVNVNPALHTNCKTLAVTSPAVINETLDIAIEVFNKSCKNMSLPPITCLKEFVQIT